MIIIYFRPRRRRPVIFPGLVPFSCVHRAASCLVPVERLRRGRGVAAQYGQQQRPSDVGCDVVLKHMVGNWFSWYFVQAMLWRPAPFFMLEVKRKNI
jgi:hypothetical protein